MTREAALDPKVLRLEDGAAVHADADRGTAEAAGNLHVDACVAPAARGVDASVGLGAGEVDASVGVVAGACGYGWGG